MIRALYSAGSGLNAQQMSIDNIAHNLARTRIQPASRRGEHSSRTCSIRVFLQPGAAAGSQTTVPSGLQLGLGALRRRRTASFSRKETSNKRGISSTR